MSFEHIDVHRVRQWAGEGAATVVDIRDPGSYAAAHIAGAVHVGDYNVEEFLAQADRTRPLVVYCYHGISSQHAAAFFAEQGFPRVFSMIGGFEAWQFSAPPPSGHV